MAQHNELGKLGEDYACSYLQLNGYVIVERDWKLAHKDLDVIALDGKQLVFIEEKTRATSDFGSPLEAITAQKMKNIVSCADVYCRQKSFRGNARFDVISLVGYKPPFQLEHIKDAFNAANCL